MHSLFGMIALMGLAWLLSSNHRRMNWRLIGVGIGLQLLFGFIIFRTEAGQQTFIAINDFIRAILAPAAEGTKFVFGPLAVSAGATTDAGEPGIGFILAFQSLAMMIFFTALVSILYYIGLMPLVVRGFSYLFTKLMRISGAESLCTASNIFVGVESATTIRPHLREMTRSELCTILTAGMATVASNVIVIYVGMLDAILPTIAGHLISASFMSAPAALIMSKILLPETEEPKTLGIHVKPHYEKENTLFEAIINGSETGIKMAFGVAALLISVIGLVALVNLGVKQIDPSYSLESFLGWAFKYPMALIGVPLNECELAGEIFGERLIKTEIPSYIHLAQAASSLSPKTVVILSYALCGFTHIASVAIFVGGISALVPERKTDIAKVAWRALLAATLACLMTACVAGLFFDESTGGTVLQGI